MRFSFIEWMSEKVVIPCPPHEWVEVTPANDAYLTYYQLRCEKDPNHVWPDRPRR
jgi:hypothetical protein